jgi:hypothetical protein
MKSVPKPLKVAVLTLLTASLLTISFAHAAIEGGNAKQGKLWQKRSANIAMSLEPMAAP